MSGGGKKLTHTGPDGAPRMVDVGGKAETRRVAEASGFLRMAPGTLGVLEAGAGPKGDPLQVARLAGIMGGKRTAELIPLCHALPGASVEVALETDPELPGVRVRATARYRGRTGVEMEALTAVSVALLTLYDMLKAVDREMELGEIRLERKSGGASGDWTRGEATDSPQGLPGSEPGPRDG